jgi:hypothetical protein
MDSDSDDEFKVKKDSPEVKRKLIDLFDLPIKYNKFTSTHTHFILQQVLKNYLIRLFRILQKSKSIKYPNLACYTVPPMIHRQLKLLLKKVIYISYN